jgi:hypothetical protein
MTPVEMALWYAAGAELPVFPVKLIGKPPAHVQKRPYTPRGFHDASRDQAVIGRWWSCWPSAAIGLPTGRASGRVVLDIDVKDDVANGFDSLEDLGRFILPDAPMVHTVSGGLHVHFDPGGRELRCSAGMLGPGLDVRGDGGYVILPSPGSGYIWDPIYGHDTPLAPAPDWLWPPKTSRSIATGRPLRSVDGLDRYGEAAIEAACNAITAAPPGQQERTLNAECFSLGTLAGAGAIPADIALRALLRAAAAMPDHDARWPWRPEEIDFKVRRAFAAGQTQPREARRALAR